MGVGKFSGNLVLGEVWCSFRGFSFSFRGFRMGEGCFRGIDLGEEGV